ncbi:MAG: EscU/YscU/HrcU family type III secretion system export apparatus switch protein [Planctomycetales bacterium]
MSDDAGDKRHPATPRRRELARAEGRAAKSKMLTSATVTLGSLAALGMFGDALLRQLAETFRTHWGSGLLLEIDAASAAAIPGKIASELAPTLLPFIAVGLVIAAAVELAQAGPMFLPDKLAPDWDRINPAAGLRNGFSSSALVRAATGLAATGIVAAVAWASLRGEWNKLLTLPMLTAEKAAFAAGDVVFWTIFKAGVALLFLACLDYGFCWFRHEQELRMTDQELRDEQREAEGNPRATNQRRPTQRGGSPAAASSVPVISAIEETP